MLPLLAPIIGGLASVAGNVGTGLLNFFGAKKEAQKQREHEFNLSQYAYSKDVSMWNKMNEYNTPEQQMKRYEEAGLNPHLIYGQGTPGNASSMPQYQAPRAEYPFVPLELGNMLGQYAQFKKTMAETDNLAEMKKILEYKKEMLYYDKTGSFYDMLISDDKYQHSLDMMGKENELISSKIQTEINRGDYTKAQKDLLSYRYYKLLTTGSDPLKDRYWERKADAVFGGIIEHVIDGFRKASGQKQWGGYGK